MAPEVIGVPVPADPDTGPGRPREGTPAAFYDRHPFRTSLLYLLIVVLVLVSVGAMTRFLPVGNIVQLGAGDAILAAIGIALVLRLDWLERAGFTTGIKPGHIPLLILPCAVALLPVANGVRVTDPPSLLVFAAATLVVGVAEETFFRGLILSTLVPTGILRAVTITSFFFAAPHLLNLIGGVWDPSFTAADMVAAFGIGITFAALRLRTGSIYPCIGIHALVDYCSLITLGGIEVHMQSFGSLLASVAIGILFVAYGLFLLRHMPKNQSGNLTATA